MPPEKVQRFDQLSSATDSLRHLTPADIDVPLMKKQLTEAGLNLNISETDRQSLAKPQFRDLDSGRGIGMVAVLGRKKAEALLTWCHQKAEAGPKLKNKGKVSVDSEGRGLRQLSADIIQLATNPEPSIEDLEEFCLRTNQRVMKGLLWESRRNKVAKKFINQAFTSIPKPDKKFSSVPPGSVADLIDFFLSPILLAKNK